MSSTVAESSAPDLGAREIGRLALIAERETGIIIDHNRPDFISSRLNRRIAALGLEDYRQYCDLLETPESSELRQFAEALTTHTTSFFREKPQYDWLVAEGLEALLATGAGIERDIVVWSAACSTGQELYTTAMVLAEHPRPLRFKGIGTDLSQKIIRQAERAVYTLDDIEGIPVDLRRRYILASKRDGDIFRIVPDIRRRCEWRAANLLRSNTFSAIDADIAFLRNVLIYFDKATQSEVLENVISKLRAGGILFTGHAETAEARRHTRLQAVRPSIYRKL